MTPVMPSIKLVVISQDTSDHIYWNSFISGSIRDTWGTQKKRDLIRGKISTFDIISDVAMNLSGLARLRAACRLLLLVGLASHWVSFRGRLFVGLRSTLVKEQFRMAGDSGK